MTPKSVVKQMALACGALAIAVLAASCGSSSSTPASSAIPAASATKPTVSNISNISLSGAGATFPYPLYSKWFDEYNKLTGVKANYQSIGSGGGIQQVNSGTVDFGASDGIMSNEEQAKAEAAFGPILHVPMTSGAVSVIVNVSGVTAGQLKLDPDVLADIFLKKIKNWNDTRIASANSGLKLPNAPIGVVHRSDGSGTTYIFTNYLSKVSKDWATQVGNGKSVSWPGDIGGKGNEGVAGQVQQVPNTIGYVELAYARQNNMAWASIKNKSGKYVEPTIAATVKAAEGIALPDDMKVMITDSANADAYPIAGFTWLLVYQNQRDQAKGKALAEMLWWAIHDGQKYAEPLDYAPLSADAIKKAESEIRSLNVNGQPLISR